MKKLVTIVLVGCSCIILMGASIWEGAAAMALGGELPESGYYIATNSFPRNTMVDVVNLENGKTLRAIVVGGIDTPGLLGLLSKEAAIGLGIEKGMVGEFGLICLRTHSVLPLYRRSNFYRDPDRDPAAALSLVETDEVKKLKHLQCRLLKLNQFLPRS